MRRFLVRNASLYTHNLLHHSSSTTAPLTAVSSHSRFRLFSSDDKPLTIQKPSPAPSIKDSAPLEIEDVNNKEVKAMIDKYLKGDEQMIPAIMEEITKRRLSGKHEAEIMEELSPEPIDDVDDPDVEGLDEIHKTDEEIVMKRIFVGTKNKFMIELKMKFLHDK